MPYLFAVVEVHELVSIGHYITFYFGPPEKGKLDQVVNFTGQQGKKLVSYSWAIELYLFRHFINCTCNIYQTFRQFMLFLFQPEKSYEVARFL